MKTVAGCQLPVGEWGGKSLSRCDRREWRRADGQIERQQGLTAAEIASEDGEAGRREEHWMKEVFKKLRYSSSSPVIPLNVTSAFFDT